MRGAQHMASRSRMTLAPSGTRTHKRARLRSGPPSSVASAAAPMLPLLRHRKHRPQRAVQAPLRAADARPEVFGVQLRAGRRAAAASACITQRCPCAQSPRTAAAPSAGAPASRRRARRAGQTHSYAQAAARLHLRLAHAPAPMLPFAERSQRAPNRRPRKLPVRATSGPRTRLCVHCGSGPSSSGAERGSGMLPLACALVRSACVLRRAACPDGPASR